MGRYLWIDKGCVVDVVFSLGGAVEPSLSWGYGENHVLVLCDLDEW